MTFREMRAVMVSAARRADWPEFGRYIDRLRALGWRYRDVLAFVQHGNPDVDAATFDAWCEEVDNVQ